MSTPESLARSRACSIVKMTAAYHFLIFGAVLGVMLELVAMPDVPAAGALLPVLGLYAGWQLFLGIKEPKWPA